MKKVKNFPILSGGITLNREEKKQATRARLFQATLELFAEQGYEATTVQQITERAGVAKGTFFNYFDSKESVFAEMKTQLAIEEACRIRGQAGPITPYLYSLIAQLTEHMQAARPLTLAIVQGNIGKARALQSLNEKIAEIKAVLVPLFQEGQVRGEFRADIGAADIVDMAVQTFFGALLYWGMGHGKETLEGQMIESYDYFFSHILSEKQQP